MQTFPVIVIALWTMTAAVGPILSLTYKSKRRPSSYKYRTIRSIEGNSEFRILACLHSTRNSSSSGLISLLKSSNPSKPSPVSAFALHLFELVGHASAMLIVNDASQPTLSESLQTLQSEFFSVHSLIAVSPYNTMHQDICSLAIDNRATLTILPFHVTADAAVGPESSVNSPFRSVNVNVLENVSSSVAVFADKGLSEGGSRLAMVFIGGRDDREALAYAWRMAKRSERVWLTVMRLVAGKSEGLASDEDEDEEGVSKGLEESEREKAIDDQYIEEFRLKTRDDETMRIMEMMAENGEEVVKLVSTMEDKYDLFVVGRGKEMVSPLTYGLSEWSEYPELGPLGNSYQHFLFL